MADNSKSDDFPTIRLDDEDRRDYQQKRQPVKQRPTSSSNQPKPPSAPKAPSSGGNGLWIFLVALVALAGVLGGARRVASATLKYPIKSYQTSPEQYEERG